MTTGLFLGLLTLYYLHRPLPQPPSSKGFRSELELERHYLNLALLFLHLYYVPSLSGILYPGADWMDPEFGESRKQVWGFGALLGVVWGAWWAERAAVMARRDMRL